MATESKVEYDDNVFAGEKRSVLVDVVNSAGSPQNMTGWTLLYQFKDKRNGSVLFSKTTGSGISIGNGAGTNDRATVTVNAADWLTLAEGWYFHTLERTDSGNEERLMFGQFYLHRA